ncbi:MAG: hypothetical protein LW870_15400 [Pirellula sp.]|jgi:hypothetical protein|nr:hypothetical protein [Pirellula sp.]
MDYGVFSFLRRSQWSHQNGQEWTQFDYYGLNLVQSLVQAFDLSPLREFATTTFRVLSDKFRSLGTYSIGRSDPQSVIRLSRPIALIMSTGAAINSLLMPNRPAIHFAASTFVIFMNQATVAKPSPGLIVGVLLK